MLISLSLHRHRLVLRRTEGEARLHLWFEAALLGEDDEDLAVTDSQGTEYLRSFLVELVESANANGSGHITYSTRWTDPDDGRIYPGTASIRITLERRELERLAEPIPSGYGCFLDLQVEGDSKTIHHIGPHGSGEWVWDADEFTSLPVELRSVGVAPDPSALPPQVPPSPPPPLSLQDIVPLANDVKSIAANLNSESNNVRAELKRIRIVLIILLVAVLGYVVARSAL